MFYQAGHLSVSPAGKHAQHRRRRAIQSTRYPAHAFHGIVQPIYHATIAAGAKAICRQPFSPNPFRHYFFIPEIVIIIIYFVSLTPSMILRVRL